MLLSHVWLFVTPWIAACQASLSFTIFRSLLKLTSTESMRHPTISSFVTLFSSCSRSLTLPGLFQWVGSLHHVAKVLEFQLQHQSFQWIFRVDFLYVWLVWSPGCPRDSQESSSAPQFKASVLQCSAFFTVQLSHLNMTTGKTIALVRWNFVGKLMSVLYNMMSSFAIFLQGASIF